MKSFVAILCLAVAATASHVHHVPSGTISVNHKGVVIAGPAGSVHTDNGLNGHGAGARLSGPSGDVRTHGGHVELVGPGIKHHGGWGGDGGNQGGDGGNQGGWGGIGGNEGGVGGIGGNQGGWGGEGGNQGGWGGDGGNQGGNQGGWGGDGGNQGGWGGQGGHQQVRIVHGHHGISHGLVGHGGGW